MTPPPQPAAPSVGLRALSLDVAPMQSLVTEPAQAPQKRPEKKEKPEKEHKPGKSSRRQ